MCKECWKKENKDKSKDKSKNSSVTTTGAIFDQLSAIHVSVNSNSPGRTLTDLVSDCDELLAKSKAAVDSAITLLTSSTATVGKGCENLLEESSLLSQQLSDQLKEVAEYVSGSSYVSHPTEGDDDVSHLPPDGNCKSPCLGHAEISAMHDVVLDHHIFDGTGGWRRSESKSQPSLQLELSVNSSDYSHLNIPCPQMNPSSCSVITDTGAQSSLMGYKIFRKCGLKDRSLIPVRRRMVAANNEGIRILGAILLRVTGKDSSGNSFETAEMVYVSDSTDQFYLSCHAMEQLRIIGPDFPSVGAASPPPTEPSPTGIHSVAHGTQSSQHKRSECGCYSRANPPA